VASLIGSDLDCSVYCDMARWELNSGNDRENHNLGLNNSN